MIHVGGYYQYIGGKTMSTLGGGGGGGDQI